MSGQSARVIPLGVGRDEWLSALQEAMRPEECAEGKTVRELSEEMGRTVKQIRALIVKLQAEGRIICRKAVRPGMDGRQAVVPVYILKPKGEA